MVSMIKKISFCVLLGVSACYSQPALSMHDNHLKTINNAWFDLGIGGSNRGVTSQVSFSVQKGIHLITIRHIYNTEFNIFGPSPSETVWDISMLYGRSWKSKSAMVSISGGLGLVGGVRRGDYICSDGWFSSKYQKCPFSTIGLPLDVQLIWMPFRFLGLGIQGFANLNSEKSFHGLVANLQIGRLR